MYFLLQVHAKIKIIYCILQVLLSVCLDRTLQPDPTTVVYDFELGVIRVNQAVLEEHIVIQGCFFHFTQSIWRKIQELWLFQQYRQDENFKFFCVDRAFLPDTASVKRDTRHLCESAPVAAEELVGCIDTNYVNRVYRSELVIDDSSHSIQMRGLRLTSPPLMCSVFHETINRNARTNNICEGWNYQFFQLVDRKYPNVALFQLC